MNYHPKHTSNSRTPVWIGAGVLAAVAIGAIIFITITLRTPMTKEEARAKAGIVYDSSATLKRGMPRAQGRYNRILKRTTHITLGVSEKA